ncbi:putative activity regulator of membrane protease YbbK [Lachnospiraceae bacterium KM106-2]|nr:putative activity regulator of membrane protease YbbK [Lachnospiraceae bacterium KM106-2]
MGAIYWLIAMAVLLVIEIITLGLTTIWFAAGALVSFIMALLGASIAIQVTVFVVVSLVLLFFTRPIALKYFNNGRVATNSESLIGQQATVTEVINNIKAEGAITINGLRWTARSRSNEIIDAGTIVKIVDIKGVKAIVIKIKEEN